ncbi:uncharacterized protein LOC117780791 [Drosophila innubila]|uniref:uncharacterized protein LOC117780791 n=1 Tax=Drosophila innubila TaxID=198719 RepID=UPI00148C45EE|nr:uncharacterized protein LOC117780791 [Drosophila innubila]
MDRYNRVWRDPKSPLTPLTPRSTQVFNFDSTTTLSTPFEHKSAKLDGCRGLKSNYLGVSGRSSTTTRRLAGYSQGRKAKHFSQDFMRIRSVFSPNAQSTASETTPKVVKQETREFKRSSPVEQPSLSPRVRKLLSRTGNEHLTELFTRQEIDIQVLIQMTLEDLESLGVRGAKELMLALDVIKFAKRFFK